MLGNWQLTNTTYSISILKHCSKASHVLILVWQEEIYSEVMIVANTHVSLSTADIGPGTPLLKGCPVRYRTLPAGPPPAGAQVYPAL